MPREYLVKGLEDSNIEAYFDHMKNVSMKLGANSSAAENEMLEVLNFEIHIANFTLSR